MNFHEFGDPDVPAIVLIHPSLVMWDFFEYVIPHLAGRYHLILPALPGYDPDCSGDFTSVEVIAAELAEWLLKHGINKLACIYGCSMGGSIVLRFLADARVMTDAAVIDGGITPYQLPRIITRLIAVRDFMMIYMGKLGGIRLLEKAFSTDDYSDEDLKYAAGVLKMISAKTIWRTFESCNNYDMPAEIRMDCRRIEYWYAENEEKARTWDIKYVKKNLPGTVFLKFEKLGHSGLAVLHPERFAAELERLMGSGIPLRKEQK